jgi:hypothetical protein
MDDEQSLQSLPPEQAAGEDGEADEAGKPEAQSTQPAAEVVSAESTDEAGGAEVPDGAAADASDDEDANDTTMPRRSIAAVGERLGQRVAQVSEAAGDKVAHATEVAGERMHHAGEVAGERVAHVGEAAGQKVILASEAAEGSVAEAQTRAAHATRRLVEQTGQLAKRIRRSTPTPVREKSAKAVESVRKNPRKAFAGSALVGIVAAVRRRGRNSDDAS